MLCASCCCEASTGNGHLLGLLRCRENTEGEYSGLEHEVVENVVESIKAGPPVLLSSLKPSHTLQARSGKSCEAATSMRTGSHWQFSACAA